MPNCTPIAQPIRRKQIILQVCRRLPFERFCPAQSNGGAGPGLDVMQFICKEFWNEVYRKAIDKLRTNHRVCPHFLCCPKYQDPVRMCTHASYRPTRTPISPWYHAARFYPL